MGSNWSMTDTGLWYVYYRKKGLWKKKPLFELGNTDVYKSMGKFKHIVWRFALRKEQIFDNVLHIYLYNGSSRIVKAVLEADADNYYKLILDFHNDQYASIWDSSEETILTQDILWQEQSFYNKYAPLDIENCYWKRRWIMYKDLDNSCENDNMSYLEVAMKYIPTWK